MNVTCRWILERVMMTSQKNLCFFLVFQLQGACFTAVQWGILWVIACLPKQERKVKDRKWQVYLRLAMIRYIVLYTYYIVTYTCICINFYMSTDKFVIALICGNTTGKPPSTWVCSHLPMCFCPFKGIRISTKKPPWKVIYEYATPRTVKLCFRSVKSQVEQRYPTVDVWTSIVEVQQIRVDTPRKQTWQWNITMFNRRYIFKWCVFHCHVSFLRWIYRGIWEGNHFEEPPR